MLKKKKKVTEDIRKLGDYMFIARFTIKPYLLIHAFKDENFTTLLFLPSSSLPPYFFFLLYCFSCLDQYNNHILFYLQFPKLSGINSTFRKITHQHSFWAWVLYAWVLYFNLSHNSLICWVFLIQQFFPKEGSLGLEFPWLFHTWEGLPIDFYLEWQLSWIKHPPGDSVLHLEHFSAPQYSGI